MKTDIVLTPEQIKALTNGESVDLSLTLVPPVIAPPPIPIPHLDTWEANMLTLAAKWKQQAMGSMSFGYEPQVWYYDGGLVYEQIAAYTKDSQWLEPADSILTQWAQYIISKDGGVQGWRVFAKGLLSGYRRTQNPLYQQAIHALCYGIGSTMHMGGLVELRYGRKHGTEVKADQYPFTGPLNPRYSPSWLRESALATGTMVVDELLTGERHPLLLCGVFDCIIPDLQAFMDPANKYDAATNPKGTYLGSGPLTAGRYDAINNFMVGMALYALIEYYELTQDALIPPVVKEVLDFFWLHCVEPVSKAQFYNSDPVNGRVDPNNPTGPALAVNYTTSSLNQLVSHAYAWYWHLSKDDTYLTQGDALWTAGVMGAQGDPSVASKQGTDYTYIGKQFSQNYMLSFKYVQYRS